LGGGVVERPGSVETLDGGRGAHGAYLASIEVAGFRGIGPLSKLELEPGPGLTVVVGRNGSGKSSFAEALEVLLTGDSYRWKNKPAEWKSGWRNLHTSGEVSVVARFAVEGDTHPVVVTRRWDDSAKQVSDASTVVTPYGKTPTDFAGYGWSEAIELYRPLLSHPELSIVADDPSTPSDALSGVLGLDELVAATELMRRRRLELEKPLKSVKKSISEELLPDLETSDDQRAAAVAEAFRGRPWDLDTAEAIAGGGGPISEDVELLDRILHLQLPSADDVDQVANELSEAATRLAALEETEAGRSRRSIDLLEAALAEHADHGDQPCPVCGEGVLDTDWRSRAEAQVQELKRTAAAYDEAARALDETRRRAQSLIAPVPFELSASVAGLETEPCREQWERWASPPADPEGLEEHLRTAFPPFATEFEQLQKGAAALKAEGEDTWRPLAVRIAATVEKARDALAQDAQAKALKRAEGALVAATGRIRSQRFQPIADRAIGLWESLRLQSNVELTKVELTGARTRRRVDLDVKVDGADTAALGVVSQGEVNCLALSLFFPRAMLPDSPFRFIVIDDPVQEIGRASCR